jgi:hypothetical protein
MATTALESMESYERSGRMDKKEPHVSARAARIAPQQIRC